MPIKNYSLLKGKVWAWGPPVDDDDHTHWELHLHIGDHRTFKALVNVASRNKDSEVVLWRSWKYENPGFLPQLSALPYGIHSGVQDLALNVLSGNGVKFRDFVIAPIIDHETAKQSSLPLDEFTELFSRAITDKAVAYVWGSMYSDATQRGIIHNIHMNQGSVGDTFDHENGVGQDGGILLEFPGGNWGALFVTFSSQSYVTDMLGRPTGPLLRDYNGDVGMMGRDHDREPISSLTKECLALFQDCQEHQSLSGGDFIGRMSARFHWWSLGIGAAKTGRSSLDHRIKARGDVRAILFDLLDSLKISLRACIKIGRSTAHFWTHPTHLRETIC